MCRILFLKGTNKEKALTYIDGLFEAGCNDPFLEGMVDLLEIPKLKNKHMHGWGYLLVSKNSVSTYMNGDAFFNDREGFDKMKQEVQNLEGEFLLMVELRVTDIGMVGPLHSHPFYFMSRNGYEGYFFYNGLLDYEKLAKLEGMDFSNFKNANGTTIMGHTFAQHLEKGASLKEALLEPIKTLKSGYNLMAFLSDNTGKHKAVLNAFTDEDLMKADVTKKYGTLIKKEDPDLFFAGSTAIGVYLENQDFQTMTNGEYLEFDIDFIEEYYFNAYG